MPKPTPQQGPQQRTQHEYRDPSRSLVVVPRRGTNPAPETPISKANPTRVERVTSLARERNNAAASAVRSRHRNPPQPEPQLPIKDANVDARCFSRNSAIPRHPLHAILQLFDFPKLPPCYEIRHAAEYS